MRPESRRDAIRNAVEELLGRSRAFRSLPPERQREISSNTVAVASAMAEAQGAVVHEVDFPDFVRDLIHGVFDAIVDASIQQMEAYAELVAAVAQSADRFLEENVSDDDARAWLDRTLPGMPRWRPRQTTPVSGHRPVVPPSPTCGAC